MTLPKFGPKPAPYPLAENSALKRKPDSALSATFFTPRLGAELELKEKNRLQALTAEYSKFIDELQGHNIIVAFLINLGVRLAEDGKNMDQILSEILENLTARFGIQHYSVKLIVNFIRVSVNSKKDLYQYYLRLTFPEGQAVRGVSAKARHRLGSVMEDVVDLKVKGRGDPRREY